jgi:hypothetical protein
MSKITDIYCVTAYYFGNKDGHSYIVGTASNMDTALKILEAEEKDRDNRYGCIISKTTLDEGDDPIQIYSSPLMNKYTLQRGKELGKLAYEYSLYSLKQEYIFKLKDAIKSDFNVINQETDTQFLKEFSSFKNAIQQRLQTIINNELRCIKAERSLARIKVDKMNIKEDDNV